MSYFWFLIFHFLVSCYSCNDRFSCPAWHQHNNILCLTYRHPDSVIAAREWLPVLPSLSGRCGVWGISLFVQGWWTPQCNHRFWRETCISEQLEWYFLLFLFPCCKVTYKYGILKVYTQKYLLRIIQMVLKILSFRYKSFYFYWLSTLCKICYTFSVAFM